MGGRKGQIAWNKGKKMPKHCGYQEGHKGYRNKESYDNADKSFFDTYEYREKMRTIALEKGYGKWMIGKKMPDKTREAIRKANVGRKKENPLSPQVKLIKQAKEYKQWRKQVFERDSYTCQECGLHSGDGKTVILHPHHIKPFSLYPKLRFEVSNGLTLCKECHKKTNTYGRGKIYRQLEYAKT